MNVKPPFFLLALAASGLAAGRDEVASVRFSNDDRLTGSMESLSADLLVWKSPLLEKPAPFFLKKVMEITLPGCLPDHEADHEAVATLTNGDMVRGQLSSVTSEVVVLDTPYAGRLNLNRLNVSSLRIQARSAALYRGPTGIEGWKTTGTKPAWTYAGAAFRSDAQGGIGREDLLPDECSISFDTAWKGDSFGFKVVIFSKDITKDASRTDASTGYEFSFQRGGFFVRNCRTSGFLGNGQAQELLENEKVRLEIRASRTTGKLCLLINDRVVEVWNDPDFKKGAFGGSLQFVSLGNQPIRISGIVISAWDGVVDQMPDPQVGLGVGGFRGGIRIGAGGAVMPGSKPAAKEKTKAGRMELANGDSIEGEPSSIKDGFVQIKSPLGEMKLPVARLRDINLKKDALETCIRRKGDVRAWFPDGTSLVFRLDGVGDGVLTGSSQNFGTADFKISAINRIEFNIHDPTLEDKRNPEAW
jgi:hypothetical protein